MSVVHRIWWGRGALPAAARAALAPAELLFRGAIAARQALYDHEVLGIERSVLPAVSVGNLSVGGTGKTPVAAWLAELLASRGARPAIVMRGYGDDEPLVHRRLAPHADVIVGADRVLGVERAAARGADVVVFDDAFQHRRAQRQEDVVLLAADGWSGRCRLLPAGPYREPLSAVRRATMVIVTRKAAADDLVHGALAAVERAAPDVPRGVASLQPTALVSATGAGARRLDDLLGARVLAISAIGNAAAFHAQLRAHGAEIDAADFPDHHAFSADEVAGLVARAQGAPLVVCTLKDAVKLAGRWPPEGPALWYVAQEVILETGRGAIEALLERLLLGRAAAARTAG
ncbi:MAG: tetraacyldisaccharide 4'-kinase [Gemmatimonadaceae bacterium]